MIPERAFESPESGRGVPTSHANLLMFVFRTERAAHQVTNLPYTLRELPGSSFASEILMESPQMTQDPPPSRGRLRTLRYDCRNNGISYKI